MIKTLLTLEYRKLKNYRPFWWLTGIHYAILFILMASLTALGEQFEFNGMGFTFSNEAFYGFPEVWQNLAYTAKWFAIFYAIIVVSSVSNEYTYRTNRQNIIDGLSRSQFVTSKVLLVLALAAIGTLFNLLAGTLLGGIYAGFSNYLGGWEFLGAYFVCITGFYSLALLLGILIRRAAMSILALLGYATLMQGIFRWQLPATIRDYRPLKAFGDLISEPFTRYIPLDTESIIGEKIDYVPTDSLIASLVWIGIFIGLCYFIESRRDL